MKVKNFKIIYGTPSMRDEQIQIAKENLGSLYLCAEENRVKRINKPDNSVLAEVKRRAVLAGRI